jgi:mono/diheme cytochrome c family protein
MRNVVFAIFLAPLLFPVLGIAQSTASAKPGQEAAAKEAKQMFMDYCASCHGVSGKGDGPAAQALKIRPADLTTLAVRNGSRFPEMRVLGAIKAGPRVPSHGSETMPVWGPIFLEVTGAATEGEVQLKIFNLMEYIKTLQVKSK